MSGTLLFIVLAALVLALLLLPLLRRRTAEASAMRQPLLSPESAPDDDPIDLALRELELDREMGKLSESDYRALRAKVEAARSAPPAPPEFRSAGRTRGPASPSAPVRDMARDGVSEEPDERAEALVRRWRKKTVHCPACGDRPEPDGRYCSNCGRVLAPCARCGSSADEPGSRFCTRCGAPLAA